MENQPISENPQPGKIYPPASVSPEPSTDGQPPHQADGSESGPPELGEPEEGKTWKYVLIGIGIGVLILIILGIIIYSQRNKQATETLKNAAIIDQAQNSTPSGSTSTGTTTPTDGTTTPSSETTVPVEENKGQPDIYIASYTMSETPVSGQEFTVQIQLGNKGNADAGAFHWEWWPKSGSAACDGKVNGLISGKSITVTCDYTYQDTDNYDTKAVADSKDEVAEGNEDNNTATKEVKPEAPKQADLSISDYKFNHDPKMGEAFTVSFKISNKGTGDAGDFYWEWWATSAVRPCREKIDGLDAGDSDTVSCTYTYPSWSTYTTKAMVDVDDDVDESNEGNNTYTKDVVPIH